MDHTGGLVIYKMDSYDEAKTLAESDPVIAQGTRKNDIQAMEKHVS